MFKTSKNHIIPIIHELFNKIFILGNFPTNCLILNNGLVKYLEKTNIISENQIGFRQFHRTADHDLTLKTIIDKYFQWNKYVHCCFIDLKSAFDTVWKTPITTEISIRG